MPAPAAMALWWHNRVGCSPSFFCVFHRVCAAPGKDCRRSAWLMIKDGLHGKLSIPAGSLASLKATGSFTIAAMALRRLRTNARFAQLLSSASAGFQHSGRRDEAGRGWCLAARRQSTSLSSDFVAGMQLTPSSHRGAGGELRCSRHHRHSRAAGTPDYYPVDG